MEWYGKYQIETKFIIDYVNGLATTLKIQNKKPNTLHANYFKYPKI